MGGVIIGVGNFISAALIAEVTALRDEVVQAKTIIEATYGTLETKTLTQLRALSWNSQDLNATVKPAYYVTPLNKSFRFNPNSTAADNGTTVIVDASSNRWTSFTIFNEILDERQ